ncbi:SDR family oxidoreductase [Flaviflagellibacter deserti]|uniref:SDR family oxidoreductase n=1 Tax=Flaviflagellibacter deserti TaxID=2267266 RepID=A0ABV9Z4D0_9HYPH
MSMPAQKQDDQPGHEHLMNPRPDYEPRLKGTGRLKGKVALITGGDSGIGRATAVAFAEEGADIAFVYLDERKDADETRKLIEGRGSRAHAISADLGFPDAAAKVMRETINAFGRLDILVNNCAEQHVVEDFSEIDPDQIERTFRTNIFSYLFVTREALKHLGKGSTIINTASITAFRGNEVLVDYSSTRGAAVAFTRALSQQLAKKGIRVNAVAPGPIWTPLIPASFDKDKVAEFGKNTPLGRPGQPNEVASCFLFLATEESSYITGQVIHVNGGTPI